MQNKKYLVIILCSLIYSCMYSMERQKQNNNFQSLPWELKLLILKNINIDQIMNKYKNIDNTFNESASITHLFQNLSNLSIYKVNKELRSLMHTTSFIESVMKQYINRKSKEEITDEFIDAAAKGNILAIKALLLSDIDPNIQNYCADTALIIASCRGRNDVVKTLLNNPKINLNIKNDFKNTALIIASINSRIEIVKILLSNPNTNLNIQNICGYTALMCASSNGNFEIVKLFLKNPKTNLNIQDSRGDTALMHACTAGDVKFLSNPEIDNDIKNNYAKIDFIQASKYDYIEIVKLFLIKLFLQKYVKVEESLLKELTIQEKELITPYLDLLNLSKQTNNGSELKALLEEVIINGYSAIVKILLQKHAIVKVENIKLAKEYNHKDIGKMLINHLGLMTSISGISTKGLAISLPIETLNHIASFLHD